MAQAIKDMPIISRRRESKYPWLDWFDGKVWAVEPEDYAPTSAKAFRANAKGAAKRLGLTVVTKIDYETGVVYLQAQAGPAEDGDD